MNVLGIETATAVCSVGIVSGEGFRGEVSLNVPFLHAEWIFPRIDELLRDSGLAARDLDGVAISIGPGSFTGLRVGLSAAKGIAIGAGCPVIAVDTLEAVANQAAAADRSIWAVVPSIRGEIFAGNFAPGREGVVRIKEDALYSRDEILAMLDPFSILIGLIPEALRAGTDEKFPALPVFSSQGLFRGTEIAFLGRRKLSRGESSDAALLEPRYLRSFPDRRIS